MPAPEIREWIKGPDGCDYANEHQVNHYARLKLCGCGCPEEAYNFCREVLKCFDRRGALKGGEWIDAEDAVTKLIISDPATAAHVVSHLLTHLDLLEHGGSVGGSWLTDEGEKIVDLREATEEDMDND